MIDLATLKIILNDPASAASFIDVAGILLIVKISVLAILCLYLIFSLTVYFQVRRLERWFRGLKRGHFSKIALSHLFLAIIGWILALIIL